jgi:hypothetical protein
VEFGRRGWLNGDEPIGGSGGGAVIGEVEEDLLEVRGVCGRAIGMAWRRCVE